MRICFTVLSLLFSLFCVNAQVLCDYRLELMDEFGDGWNGAALQLTINGNDPLPFFLSEADGKVRNFNILIRTGDSIRLEFFAGRFDNEVSYSLFDTNGNLVFRDGPNPRTGVVFRGTTTCPACPPPALSFININNIRAEFIDISWQSPDPNGTYWIRYDTAGFDLNTARLSRLVRTNRARLGGLIEKTKYEFYITSLCASGDTSTTVGPIPFETVFKNDVGIVAIVSPTTACGLNSMETLEITLKNFGANPQTLIPFDFSINGVAGDVPMPFDGVFTGVLGKDSTFTIEFDTKAMVGTPNLYEIKVWTALETDSDNSNDTFSVTLINIPLVQEYPYFTNFEDWFGGWRVDDTLSQNPSWAFGTPSFRSISGAASGRNAWVTGLREGYNNSERSYLLSPCLDFSSLTEDPRLTFSLFIQTEACCDRAWVEVSTNGGVSWTKVGTETPGRNWYNNRASQHWSGNGGFSGWVTASNTLAGTAGKEDVQIRFVFSSDFSTTDVGIAIDDIFISPPLQNDLAALRINRASDVECGSPRDEIVLTITNQGEAAQEGFTLSYQVNGGNITTEPFPVDLRPGETFNFTFDAPFNSSQFNEYLVKAWINNVNEQFLRNDTITFNFVTVTPISYFEDFESGQLPRGWKVTDELMPVTNAHGAPSFVLSDNLWALDPFFEATAPAIGTIQMGDSLTFDYRFVNFGSAGNSPKVLGRGDSLVVQFSTDCGNTYRTVLKIDSLNHIPSVEMRQISIRLDDFVGQNVKTRFIAFWGSGDYYLDIDNFGVIRCPSSLNLVATVKDETRNGTRDGGISIDPRNGAEPFSYQWSTGATAKAIAGLSQDFYTVIVRDKFGCTDSLQVEVGVLTNTQKVQSLQSMTLAPNPTSGTVNLNVALDRVANLQIRIFNAVGQLVQQLPMQQLNELNVTLDLSNQKAGIYFVQLQVEGEIYTQRLVLFND